MKYKIYWKSQSIKDAKHYNCGSEAEAQAMFLKDNQQWKEVFIIESEEGLVEKEIIEPPKQVATQDSPKASSTSIEDKPNQISTASLEEKLDKLYDVMNHIRWIGLSIAGMFAITFIIPHLIN